MKKIESIEIDLKTEEILQVGRPPKRYKEDFVDIAGRLTAAGFTHADLGYVFKVAPLTIDTWKNRYPEFKQACDEGKRIVKGRLVASAIKESMGYDFTSSKTKYIKNKDGEIIKEEKTVFSNHQPANHNLLMFVLCNIARQLGDNDWASKHTLDVTDGGTRIKIEGKLEGDKILQLVQKLTGIRPAMLIESTEIKNDQDDQNNQNR